MSIIVDANYPDLLKVVYFYKVTGMCIFFYDISLLLNISRRQDLLISATQCPSDVPGNLVQALPD